MAKKNSKIKIKTKKKVVYDVYCLYDGYDPEFDEQLNSIAGKHSHSSGFFIREKQRDLTWEFFSKKEAERICAEIKGTNRIVEASIHKVS